MATVSVIIPAYNAGAFIASTIESALGQTYRDVEVIVVDDGSSDDTGEVVGRYGDRVRYVRQENAGVAAARNVGLTVASGDFIALLDHDDLWLPTKLEKQMRLFERNPDLGLVFSDTYVATLDGELTGRFFDAGTPPRGHALAELFVRQFVPCLTAVIPGRVIKEVGPFQRGLALTEDWDLFLKIAERYPFDFVDEPLAVYRVHESNFSNNIETGHTELIALLDRWIARRPDVAAALGSRLRRSRARHRNTLARHYLVTGRAPEARAQVRQSLRLSRLQVTALALYSLSYLPRDVANWMVDAVIEWKAARRRRALHSPRNVGAGLQARPGRG